MDVQGSLLTNSCVRVYIATEETSTHNQIGSVRETSLTFEFYSLGCYGSTIAIPFLYVEFRISVIRHACSDIPISKFFTYGPHILTPHPLALRRADLRCPYIDTGTFLSKAA